MQTKWLIKQERNKLLLFVNGWGMDEKPFQLLGSDEFDVFMLYDYRELAVPVNLRALCQPYHEIHLMAWSLGVWVCQQLKEELPERIVFSLAVNGTLQPIHPRYGIPPEIFESTLKNLSARTLHNFYQNMFSADEIAKLFLQHLPSRPVLEIIEELHHLKILILAEAENQEVMGFDAALIGNRDMIISPRNQLRFWQNQSNCRMAAAGHFPFYNWKKWEDIFVHRSHE
jgi:pimeloyl-[acyl-carrier protein] methyl ester esterase